MNVTNSIGIIPTSEQMREIIKESHRRSESYGVSRKERNTNHFKLSPALLKKRKDDNVDILAQVRATVEEFYEFMSPDDFSVGFADRDGYVLNIAGGETALHNSDERQFSPGYRWTEQDVGTSATSLCLKLKIPIQLNDKDHYCKRAHGFISSAAPIFGHKGVLLGILCVVGASSLVHPHTLIMITSAARSIERNMRLLRRNKEMSMYLSLIHI